jgi:hypothetical protein
MKLLMMRFRAIPSCCHMLSLGSKYYLQRFVPKTQFVFFRCVVAYSNRILSKLRPSADLGPAFLFTECVITVSRLPLSLGISTLTVRIPFSLLLINGCALIFRTALESRVLRSVESLLFGSGI